MALRAARPLTTSFNDGRVAALGYPLRVWAVGPVYGHFGALCQLHEMLLRRLRPFERVVYLGNYLGAHSQWSGEGAAVLGELISFRNTLIALPGFFAEDVVFLRGRMEDLAFEATRLPFQKPGWLEAALASGLESYLSAYGIMAHHIEDAAQPGVFSANRFAQKWQALMRSKPGHAGFYRHLHCAAATNDSKPIAFVPEGLEPSLPLHLQRENLYRPEKDITRLPGYFSYQRIVRGAGPVSDGFVLTLDGGNHLEGVLHAACLDPDGQIIEHLVF
ncbi:MAG TPA: hypothetical protein VHB73_01005 [Alphaproteobacteria bacterium]|nr:hypothetical protein [Alphaproteobacteria bacterium]